MSRETLDKLEVLTEKLQQSESIIKSVIKIQGMFLQNDPPNIVFDRLLSILLFHTKSEYGFLGRILYRDDKTPFLKTYAITNISWDEATRKFYEENAPSGLEFTNLKTLFGETIKTKKVVLSNSPSKHPSSGGLPKGHPPLNSYLGIPLMIKGDMIGMVGIANRKDGYTFDILDKMEVLLNSIAQLVHAQSSILNNRENS
jgi:transcriptional regulator with GAF, ATPase, and Fis domain